MTFTLWMILSAHMAFASTLSSTDLFLLASALEEGQESFRTIEGREAEAFETVFGTSDMEKLLEIESNPKAYWEEREAVLKGEAITHRKFCKTYAEEAKAYIRDRASKKDYHLWFCQDPNVIEDTIKSKISEDHPAYPTLLALYTGMACDSLDNSSFREDIGTQQALLQEIDTLLANTEGLTEELNQRQRWVIRNKGIYSIFDGLIMLSNGEYLCGAAPPDQRPSFEAHVLWGHSLFWGFHGPISHDSLAHARRQQLARDHLRGHGVSFQEYFCKCWNKENLVKNNIFQLAQRAMGCYYRFHELLSIKRGWRSDNLHSLMLPATHNLTDPGFMSIMPFFKDPPKDFNWHTHEINPLSDDSIEATTHAVLSRWAEIYCHDAYIEIIQDTLRVHPSARLRTDDDRRKSRMRTLYKLKYLTRRYTYTNEKKPLSPPRT